MEQSKEMFEELEDGDGWHAYVEAQATAEVREQLRQLQRNGDFRYFAGNLGWFFFLFCSYIFYKSIGAVHPRGQYELQRTFRPFYASVFPHMLRFSVCKGVKRMGLNFALRQTV